MSDQMHNPRTAPDNGSAQMNKAHHVARLIEEISQLTPTAASSVESERRISVLQNAQRVLKEIRNEFAGEAVQKGYRA